jgi:hypothetical protein
MEILRQLCVFGAHGLDPFAPVARLVGGHGWSSKGFIAASNAARLIVERSPRAAT